MVNCQKKVEVIKMKIENIKIKTSNIEIEDSVSIESTPLNNEIKRLTTLYSASPYKSMSEASFTSMNMDINTYGANRGTSYNNKYLLPPKPSHRQEYSLLPPKPSHRQEYSLYPPKPKTSRRHNHDYSLNVPPKSRIARLQQRRIGMYLPIKKFL